jgi:hypothetical protein
MQLHKTLQADPVADFPEQGRLIDTVEHPIDRAKYDEAMRLCRRFGREQGIDKAMADHNADIIAFMSAFEAKSTPRAVPPRLVA